MKNLLKEPLFHFLILGACIFLVFAVVNSEEEDSESIILDTEDLNALIVKWEAQWKRPPSEKELEELLKNKVRQEIYYQEALKMNLDHNDEIIKRRLAQKMEFLSNDFAALKTTEEQELVAYYDTYKNNYVEPASYSFYQIVFTGDHHQDPEQKAKNILVKFPNATVEEMKNKGDRFSFDFEFSAINSNQLNLKFGSNFAEQLEALDSRKWAGPIRSGFGYHLIFISEKVPSYIPKLEAVKERVLQDYNYAYQESITEDIYQGLKKNYIIELHLDSDNFASEYVYHLESQLNN